MPPWPAWLVATAECRGTRQGAQRKVNGCEVQLPAVTKAWKFHEFETRPAFNGIQCTSFQLHALNHPLLCVRLHEEACTENPSHPVNIF